MTLSTAPSAPAVVLLGAVALAKAQLQYAH